MSRICPERLGPAFVLTALLVFLAAKPAKEKASKIDALVQYEVPSGWSVEKGGGKNDSWVRLSSSLNLIQIQLYGGTGSRYAKAEDFLSEHRSSLLPEPAVQIGTVTVQGLSRPLYRSRYSIEPGDPHEANPNLLLAREEFCLVPAGGKFLVLSYSYEGVGFDPAMEGQEAWKTFLKGFKVKKRSRPPKRPKN